MKIPFSVLYFFDDILFSFIGVRDNGRTIPLQKTKALFRITIIISMYASESLLCGAFSASWVSTSGLFIFETVFGRSASCMSQIASCWLGGEICYY